MSLLGFLHFALMVGALVIGVAIFLKPKGTAGHKKLGRVFFAGMLVSNLVVLTIYRDSDQPSIFHILAIVSALSLIVAVVLVRLPGAEIGRRIAHGHIMLWSYGGVVAAGLGQGATFFWLYTMAHNSDLLFSGRPSCISHRLCRFDECPLGPQNGQITEIADRLF